MEALPLIAVVDDEEIVRRALTRVLETANFEVASFASGGELLEWLVSYSPDCIVLDFQMPGMDGREVQKQLVKRWPHLPIVVLTAHDYPAVRKQFVAEGVAAYLHKPLHRQKLLSTLNAILHR